MPSFTYTNSSMCWWLCKHKQGDLHKSNTLWGRKNLNLLQDNSGISIIQHVCSNDVWLVQIFLFSEHDQNSLPALWIQLLPENDVPSLVSLPSLDQCKVSSDGLFHDVVPAIELLHLRSMTTQFKEWVALNTVKAEDGDLFSFSDLAHILESRRRLVITAHKKIHSTIHGNTSAFYVAVKSIIFVNMYNFRCFSHYANAVTLGLLVQPVKQVVIFF